MIKGGTVLKVIDNSGAKKVRCIKVFKVGKRGDGAQQRWRLLYFIVEK